MTSTLPQGERADPRGTAVVLDVVVPVHDEEADLEPCVRRLHGVARVGRALVGGRLPVAELRAQLGRAPLEPRTPGVPVGLIRQVVRFGAVGVAPWPTWCST